MAALQMIIILLVMLIIMLIFMIISKTNNNHYNYTNSTLPRFKKIMLNVRNMRFTVTEMLCKCDSHGLMLCRFA